MPNKPPRFKLPTGVHRHVGRPRKGQPPKIRYYWHPGRGTPQAGVRVRLPDDPHSPQFWTELNRLRAGNAPPVAPIDLPDKTIEQMIDAYIASHEFTALAGGSQKKYLSDLRWIKQDIGHLSPDSLRHFDVVQARDAIADQDLIGKANGFVTALSSAYKWGMGRGWSLANPAAGIKKLKGGEWEPWPAWALAEYQQLLPEPLAKMAAIALHTGQRVSDVIKMHRDDITEVDGVWTLYVKQKKTGKELWLPLHPALEWALDRSGWLVPRRDGERYSEQNFDDAWRWATLDDDKCPGSKLRRANCKFHGLRKNAAVHLAEVGCTTHEIASITGMSLEMIQHYTKGVEQKRLAVVAMGKLVKGRKRAA